jgi:hypothetical protein
MTSHILRFGLIVVLAAGIAVSLRADSSAYYGDPRFWSGQASSHVLHNYYPGHYPSDEFIVTNPSGTSGQRVQMTGAAVTAWNNALRGTPNSLGKYPFHYNQIGDANATIVVNFVTAAEVDANCHNTFGDGCNDGAYPVSSIWIDSMKASTQAVMHELGHSFAFDDQYYYPSGNCSPADTIMDAWGCTTGITGPDNTDFQYHYEPTYQSANPSYPDTWNASWNAYTQMGSVTEDFAASDVEWRYFWQKESDTGGTVQGSGYTTQTDETSLSFGYSTSRFCLFSKVYNEVGYPGSRPWSPRSQYSCVGSAQSQAAGYFLSTSDRNSSGTNNLYLRVKNFTGFDRDIAIVGPAFEQIGCGYARKGWLATRECNISLARGSYSYLQWYAKDPNNPSVYSYGFLDFE